MTLPEFQRQVQTVANQGREGMQRQGRSSQETIVQSRGRVLVPPQGIHITSLSSSEELKPPTNGSCYLLDEEFFIPERRSQFDNLDNNRSSSGDCLRPD